MKRVLLTVAAGAGALAMAVPLAATADHKPGHSGGKPQGTGNLTITATPNPVRFGREVTISGTLRGKDAGAKAVELQHDPFPYGTDYESKPVATGTTTADGDYTFKVSPKVNTNYRVVAKTDPEARSDNLTVGVKPRVTRRVSDATPRKGETVTFRGTVTPAHDGRRVYVQRRKTDGTWATVASTRLTDNGTASSAYKRGLRINRDGVFRVKITTHGDHVSNVSRRIRLDVP